MRALLAASLLGFLVLGLSLIMGASAPQTLMSEHVDPAATTDPSNRHELAPQHVALHIINGFSAEEETNIIAAIVAWNPTGAVRLDVSALNYNAVESGAWSIVKLDDGANMSSGGRSFEARATTRRMSADSGSIVVNVAGLAGGDLRRVIAQELSRTFGRGGELALSPDGTRGDAGSASHH